MQELIKIKHVNFLINIIFLDIIFFINFMFFLNFNKALMKI
jgi:hypothetical protein